MNEGTLNEVICIDTNPCCWGTTTNKNITPDMILEVGKIYQVDYIDTSSRFNQIFLKGIPDIWFGTMAFDKGICSGCIMKSLCKIKN